MRRALIIDTEDNVVQRRGAPLKERKKIQQAAVVVDKLTFVQPTPIGINTK